MSQKETPGSRLRDLIEKRGYKMKVFAEISGVIPTTLSRYVNDKQKMSDKYIKRVAEIFDVSPEYIKCEFDDMTPTRYLQYEEEMSDIMKNSNRQQYQFFHMEKFLKTLRVDFIWKAEVENKKYVLDNYGEWHTVDNPDGYGIPDYDFMELIRKNHDDSIVWIEMTFMQRKITMHYEEFQRWMRSMVATIELKVQERFDTYYDISLKVFDSDVDKAIRGEDPLRFISK